MDIKKHTKANIEKIADLPFYTEGPVIDGEGNVYCTTLLGGLILKIDRAGKIHEWGYSDCPNGQIILPSGEHLICEVKLNCIARFDVHGQYVRDEIKRYCAGIPFYAPNDLLTDAAGNIYFTDSIRKEGKVCFKGVDGVEKIVASGLDYPNGLVFAPGEQWLYVSESYRNRILRIDLKGPGISWGKISVLATLPGHPSGEAYRSLPDGLALDKEGNVWVAHYGMQAIHQLSPEGQLLASIDTGIPLTSNLAFEDEHTLIVTGGHGEPSPGSLLRIHLVP